VSKCIVIGVGVGSFLLSTVASSWLHRLSLPVAVPLLFPNWQLWRLVTQHLFFSSTSEAVFGLFLLYHFRVFERRMGSSKYAVSILHHQSIALALTRARSISDTIGVAVRQMFAVLVSMLATLIQLVFFAVLRNTNRASGPYALIFASFYLYLRSIPPTQRVRLFSLWLSDKAFTYLAGAQLILMNFPSALLFAIAGVTGGAIYQSDLINVRSVHFPQALTNWCTQHLLPLIEPAHHAADNAHAPPSGSASAIRSPSTVPRATAAAATAVAAASFAPPLVPPIYAPVQVRCCYCSSWRSRLTN